MKWNGRSILGIGAILALVSLGATRPAQAIDESELPLKYEETFTNIRPRRPVVITHAGDGSDRLFIVTQQGVIHVIPNRPDVDKTTKFLDIESKVAYADNQNEEGLLGLAFHPKYKENGQFFVYYTTSETPQTSIISRFTVSKDDPNHADPESEVEIMRISQPFWNHNGGTIVFGPDGYLYVGLGDGGKFNDPQMNGQNIQTLLGSILRIDVDHQEEGRKYAIPKDNPFYGQDRFARGEIYAYGLRNVWRMSFDRETGTFWAADVGQDTWEEINIVKSGGNYGWNLREAMHPFGPAGAPARDDLIEPIFEYHHDIGKSITGGNVYRGKALPELNGYYLYGDYVSGKIWALKRDEQTGEVTENRLIPGENVPVITFGEDEQGEIYFSDPFGRIFKFAESK